MEKQGRESSNKGKQAIQMIMEEGKLVCKMVHGRRKTDGI